MPRGMRLINKLENTLCFVPLGAYSLKYQLATLKVLLLLLSGVSLQAIPYLGMNVNCGRDRKILSSIVEVMEVSDSEENCHISDGNLSEQGQVEVNV